MSKGESGTGWSERGRQGPANAKSYRPCQEICIFTLMAMRGESKMVRFPFLKDHFAVLIAVLIARGQK